MKNEFCSGVRIVREMHLRIADIETVEDAKRVTGELGVALYFEDISVDDFNCLMTDVAKACQSLGTDILCLFPISKVEY